ncbi:MAG TPA: ATP-binding protein [Candidatus Limnocylindria bacterium]|nr:ATP-binding protein [Candidatus Limnocylindria bacterium]
MIQLTLLCAAILSALLAYIVIANNRNRAINKVYFLLSLTAALWLWANALVLEGPLTPDSAGVTLFVGRLITPSAVVLTYSMMLFIVLFANRSVAWGTRRLIYLALLGAPIILLSFTKLNLSLAPDKSLRLGALYIPFVGVILTYLSLALYVLFFRVHTKKDKTYSTQVRYLRNAFLISVIPAASFGAILPLFTTSEVSNLGPISSTIFLLYAAWLIIRHRLFDIRPVVAKVIAYTLLLTTVLSLFGFFTFFVASQFNIKNEFVARQLIPFGLATFIAFLLQPTKKFFDKLTNRLFYQDAYDSQIFLDELNKAIVSSIEIDQLLTGVWQVVERHLKARYVAFNIPGSASLAQHIVESDSDFISRLVVEELRSDIVDLPQRTIFVDNLVDAEGQATLYKQFVRNRVSVIVKMKVSLKGEDEQKMGVLLLGDKKSGNPYNSQDIKILEIIANELVIAIQNALRFEEIQKFNITLQEEVERATAQLTRTNEKLRALDETKDDFISMASHQLRTPLTSVKGYLSMVLEGDVGKLSPRQAKLLDQAFVSSQRMVYLIADLLNVSRLRTGKFVIEAKPTNLAEVIEGEVEQLVETAAARGLKLTYKKPAQFPDLMLDETKIRQVIMNFVDNAIYYTRDGGHITVSLSETPQSIQFNVIDDGIGVPKHEQHHLFTKFYRAGNARKARPDGTGLGLFMAKKVVIAQGGSILFRSTEGKGSTFGFTFAKAPLVPPASPQVVSVAK